MTPHQKRIIQTIVQVFETGTASARAYGTAVILSDGAGITYGRHQATARSGALEAIIRAYAEAGGLHGHVLEAMIPLVAQTPAIDPRRVPEWAREAMELLRSAGDEEAMRTAQDDVFDRLYWPPAHAEGVAAGLVTPLAYLALYDTAIQSGPAGIWRIRRTFREACPAKGGDEHAWVRAYHAARRRFLGAHPNELVRASVYRVRAQEQLAEANAWDLLPPLVVRGETIR